MTRFVDIDNVDVGLRREMNQLVFTSSNALRLTEKSLTRVKNARSGRAPSWDTTGRNNDAWDICNLRRRAL